MKDNFDFYEQEEKRLAALLMKCPICEWCGEPIQEDYAFRIHGDLVCQHCIEDAKENIDNDF